jgi:hypothetical protein
MDALRRSYMIELMPPYSRNASQRVIKSPQIVRRGFGSRVGQSANARLESQGGFELFKIARLPSPTATGPHDRARSRFERFENGSTLYVDLV